MSEKQIILFESYPDFNGSTLEIYNELIKRGFDKKYNLVWAVDKTFNLKTDKKIVKYFGMPLIERNKILNNTKLIIDSNRYINKHNNFRIHVRHGCCLKNTTKYNSEIGQVDAIITTSEEMLRCDQQIWPDYLKNKFIITGMPACDKLFSPKNLYDIGFIKELTNSNNKFSKIIGWLPTFRQHRYNPSGGSKKIYKYGLPLINNINDFIQINEKLKSTNMLLLIQMHHAQAKNYTQLTNYSNIKFINEPIKLKYNLSTTDLLGNFDALITDYSSAYHEYIILNRPIALTIDDLIKYSKSWGFFINYLDWIKGDYIINNNALLNWLSNISMNLDINKNNREESLHKIHKYIDNKSTNRVTDYIINKFKL